MLNDFVGWKSSDGFLEVIGIEGRKGHNLYYKVICSSCSKDKELYPVDYFISTKEKLLRGVKPCGCANTHRWDKHQQLILAKRKAGDKISVNLTEGDFVGVNTRLDCECSLCKFKWTPTFCSFIRKSYKGCPRCNVGSPKGEFIGWKSDDLTLEVIGVPTGNHKNRALKVTCIHCSKDTELFPEGYFISNKGNLLKGQKPCGCSKSHKWTKDQYIILAKRKVGERFLITGYGEEFKGNKTEVYCECPVDGHKWTTTFSDINRGSGCRLCGIESAAAIKRKNLTDVISTCNSLCNEEGYTFIGFVDGYVNHLSKFEYLCNKHGKQTIDYGNFLNGGKRCRLCHLEKCKDNYGYMGYYKEREDETDTLYILNFNNNYIKVGRSFDLYRRIGQLKTISKCKDISVIWRYEGLHKHIYKLEQEIHNNLRLGGFEYREWSIETFSMDCLPQLREFLKDSEAILKGDCILCQ